ncbi:hypothetical protein CGGC5_v010247 [Colletotrichum fructicola Nara gc5]|uniref:Uncharacterized protein n=1 Tax=Colletotrichum fructicola (strain Nara gc5) TaxID=1213859 RepID=A0A7J6J3H7_COLFN|nr:hypothetical protein CGGC5_v010247 [Colletotrichum fructicola Nara gc5]
MASTIISQSVIANDGIFVRTDLVGLAAISLIEGDLKLLWRKIISQALSFEEALKIVRRHVSLHFSYLESLAITKTQRTLVITLKLVEKKVSAIIIEAIESNAESEDEASLKPSARLEGSQELLDRQGFLAHGQAIEELKARLKDTVTDESSSFPKSALTTYYAGIRNVLDRFSAKLTRACGTSETGGTPKAHIMEWTCPSCGRRLRDRYVERQDEAIEKLKMLLNAYSSRRWKEEALPMIEAEDAGRTQSKRIGHLLPSFWNWPQQADTPTHKFVLLCIPYMRWGTKAHHPDVCAIESDQQFFNFLRASYGTYRTQGRWNWLRNVKAIDLVKFELFRNELANVYDSAFSPVGSDFEYKQSDTEPPIGPNLMMHLFENPNHADIFPVLLRRIPRKTKERLRPCPKKGSSIGWGVQFKETLNGMYVFAFGCIGFMLCLVISVVYTLMKDDIQGGFAIGGFVLAFLLFCGGTLHPYVA